MSLFSRSHGTAAAPVAALLALLPALFACSCDEPEEDLFSTRVIPLVEQRCANGACHGAAAGHEYELDAARWLTFPIDAGGRITDPAAAQASMVAKINSAEDPAFSTLLRKTLPVAQGGMYHFQGAIFPSRDDEDYLTLAGWAATVQGTEGLDEPPLDALEQRFADTVYPVLVGKGCATSTCHGDLNFGVTTFRAPPVPGAAMTSRKELRATYHESRRNLTLWGDPVRSRLLAKMLPLESGGIPHKGGNDVFFASEVEQGKDPRTGIDATAILAWLMAEREAELGEGAPDQGLVGAIVFVGGAIPVGGPFDVLPFTPGSDLYVLDAPFSGTPRNLTAAIHDEPADIRDPAVSHDGESVVFSMRTSERGASNIYSMRLDGTGLSKLTSDSQADGTPTVANFAPIYGPNGGATDESGAFSATERIYFSSTREAGWSDDSRFQNADLWAMDLDGANLERLTFTVTPEVAPTFLSTSEFSGTLAYTIKRSAEGGYKGVFFRFPVDHNPAFHFQPEAHPHFGMSEPQQVFFGLRELPEGRATLTLLDAANQFRAGQLAVLERQFAVELPDGTESSATLPGFRHALTTLFPEQARTGPSAAGAYRDPSPMPDGSILAASLEGPIDLSDPTATPRSSLVRVYLQEDRATNRPKVLRVEPIFASADFASSQPVAVYTRGTEDPPHARSYGGDAPGTVVHSGVQVIEAVIAQLPPSQARTVREDLAIVRVMVPLAVAGPLVPVAVPPEETRDGYVGATTLSLTGRMPLFAAVEVPVAPDGSLAAHVPARVPLRVVTLDAERISTGALQHHWYAVQPGERFPVGIPESSFSARCAGCHGAMDGKAESVLQPPVDVVTQASVTDALYAGSDRRKPLALPTVDASMFVLVDFQAHVQPVLTAKCATSGCHAGPTPVGGLSLTADPTTHYTDAYESLLRPGTGSAGGFEYVDAAAYRARGSYLAEKVLGRELEAPRELTQACPPPGSEPLTDDERLAILRWIEFGSSYVGVPPSP